MERQGSLRLHGDDEIISDETFETMLDALDGTADDTKVAELLQAMNENRIISREEADQIMEIEGPNKVIKCGLPPSVRPTDPENTTDPEECVSRLLKNDPSLVEINLNNMKRTPIPVIQRMLMALNTNTHLKRIMLANTALTDTGCEPILEALENNTTLELLNVETNFLSGEFLAKLFNAALVNMTLREIKAVNQSPTFSTEAEMDIMNAVNKNRGLTKVSVNLRHPEAKNKVEQACLRNGEIRRQLRRMEQLEKQKEVEGGEEHVTDNHVDQPKTQAKEAPKKEPVKKLADKPAAKVVKKEETKPVEKKPLEKEKVPEKKPVEPPKKPVVEPEKKVTEKEKEKPAPKRELGKKTEEKPAPVETKAKSPAPPPAPKVEPPKEAPPATTAAPEKPKPTLAMAAKEAAAKAASRGFGQSESVTPKKKTSVGERSKGIIEPLPAAPMETPAQIAAKSSASRPGTLNIGASKDVPTSKGLGAATFGTTATPKPSTPSKTEPPKGRRGSGTIKPPTPATPTGKDTPTKAPWSPIKPPGTSAVGSKGSDAKSKTDSMTSSITEKKPVTYGYGSSMKKRDSTK